MTSKLYLGDCLDILATLDENSIDTCITDPPYGLGFMGKEWDTFDKSQFGIAGNEGENDLKVKKNFKVLPRYNNGAGLYDFTLEWASQVYRVLKPGALLLAFGGTRTYHRMVCAIEDAGFEIRDTIAWVYGSGFPKSYDISKGIDRMFKAKREVIGYTNRHAVYSGGTGNSFTMSLKNVNLENGKTYATAPATPEAQLWDGWGTALKPAMELIVVAMKPLDGTYTENALKWGVAGMWIDGGRIDFKDEADYLESTQKNRHGDFNSNNGIRVPTKGIYHGDNRPPVNYEPKQGRFPSNFTHDGSDEVLELFPDTGKSTGGRIGNKGSMLNMMGTNYEAGDPGYGDSGSAARFFYCAKASRGERNAGLDIAEQNLHPTVKPIALMRYLARITKTPTGGTVLDPFMGSGTTGIACALEGRDFIGIEKEREYYEIAEKRINYWSAQPPLL